MHLEKATLQHALQLVEGADDQTEPQLIGISGLTSAPQCPQTVQTKRSSRSDSRTDTSRDRVAAFIIAAMDGDPGVARCAHFAEGDFLLSWH